MQYVVACGNFACRQTASKLVRLSHMPEWQVAIAVLLIYFLCWLQALECFCLSFA